MGQGGTKFIEVAQTIIPTGQVKLGLEFAITGQFEITPELTQHGVQGVKGQATLYINDEAVGSGEIGKTVPFGWSLSGEGLCCGYDSETPVSELYQAPFKFTGQLERLIVSVSGQPFRHITKEVANTFLIQ